jgi:hypothetical protein
VGGVRLGVDHRGFNSVCKYHSLKSDLLPKQTHLKRTSSKDPRAIKKLRYWIYFIKIILPSFILS